MNNHLKYLFLDLNSYFASVEQQENPKLRGKPVAVVPMNTPHTCAIAASYEAKAYGVKTGTIIRDAKKRCPNLICVQARHDKYVEYHDRIIQEAVKHTPINKIWSIDEFDSRLPHARRTHKHATEIAMRLKDGLRQNIGPSITCSIGIAPNSLLAKIASDMQKTDGLVLLTADNLQERLFRLHLTDLPGIGANMEKRLHRAGITSVEAFWNISPKHARKIWGSVQGERFWYRLHGHDIPQEDTKEKSMIGHSRVLDPNSRSPEKARLIARRLLSKAAHRLRKESLYAGTLSLGVSIQGAAWPDKIKWKREIQFTPACDPFTFLQHLDKLWIDMRHYFHHAHNIPTPHFKKVSTLLLSLRHKEQITEDLFNTASPQQTNKLEKQEALTKALDHLQKKYKKETVTLGVPPKTQAGYVGTKIAFNRVPDQEEFWS